MKTLAWAILALVAVHLALSLQAPVGPAVHGSIRLLDALRDGGGI